MAKQTITYRCAFCGPQPADQFYVCKTGQPNCYCIPCDKARRRPDFLPPLRPAENFCPLLAKRCSTCGEVKPLSAFRCATNGRNTKRCDLCIAQTRKRYNESARGRSMNRAWRRTKRGRAVTERHRQIRISKGTEYERQKRKHIAAVYGITVERFNSMVEKQKGLCAICGQPPTGKRLHIDHDHETGQVRALLCSPCNIVLGLFKEDPVLLDKAKAYLRQALIGENFNILIAPVRA